MMLLVPLHVVTVQPLVHQVPAVRSEHCCKVQLPVSGHEIMAAFPERLMLKLGEIV